MAPASYSSYVAANEHSPQPSNLEAVIVICIALVFVLFCSGTAALVGCYRRRTQVKPYARRTQSRTSTPVMVDLERQACTPDGTDGGKNSPRFLTFPPLAVLARSWSASGSPTLGKQSLELPPPALAVAPSSRLRDSVLCKVLGQLTWPAVDNDKSGNRKSRRIVDVEAAADNNSPQYVPEWIRPHLAQINEQSKREWTLYTPSAPIVVPQIVISCDEVVPDTPSSTYSDDSTVSELDTPPPMTPTLSSPVSFFFPASPSFSVRAYLQVPSPSFHAPREEAKPVMRNVSNFSGKTFALAAPTGRFSKLRERRMMVQAQVVNNVIEGQQNPSSATQATAVGYQVVHGCGTGPRVLRGTSGTVGTAQVTGTGVVGVGLGLQLRPQLDFQDFHNTSATSGSSGDDATHGPLGSLGFAGYSSMSSVLEASLAADVALPTAPASPDDDPYADAYVAIAASAPSDGDDHDKGRPERLAHLIDAFDSSVSLASLESDSAHGKLCDIMDDYRYDYFDDYLDGADADESINNEVAVHERHAVVVYAV
ncbi:uncharacterized protein TRAVEDRAFT_21995 [Trametes versicolor FP-101664 SS1]|uniref:uncharacterized protein n=1 Tax=Trametes versicolor (strain FP-101664) TaxID=717944 RepID=UPI000462394C|nr:uncharacterized protein TRAVEDRAFT_21995 [Trametes versicolor FP-101664 SS1]EIW55450.1 hypothetical protein TRAVEDRAFT_21995 [Trametes versicolor FP-101664 SS1]